MSFLHRTPRIWLLSAGRPMESFTYHFPLVCPTVAIGKTLALPTKATDEMAQARRYDCAYSSDPSTMLILRNAKQHQIG